MIAQTLTAGQLRGWLTAHGVRDAHKRINATAQARDERGCVLAYRGRRYTIRRLVVAPRIYYTVDAQKLRT